MTPNKCDRCGKEKENVPIHEFLHWEDPCDNLIECRRDSTLNWFLCQSCIVEHISNLMDHWVETTECIDKIKEIIERQI